MAGLRARSGFADDLEWKGCKLESAMVRSGSGTRCRVLPGGKFVDSVLTPGAGRTITFHE